MIQPRDVPPPGEILLEEFLRPAGLTQTVVADRLRWTRARLNQVIKGHRAITAEAALDLAAVFGTTPQFWMNLQSMYDVDRALTRREKLHVPYPKPLPHALVAAERRR
jgi:addiction module HigA family antidote